MNCLESVFTNIDSKSENICINALVLQKLTGTVTLKELNTCYIANIKHAASIINNIAPKKPSKKSK